MDKIYTLFQTKTAKKTIPFGAANTDIAYIAYIREYPSWGGGLGGWIYGVKTLGIVFNQPSEKVLLQIYSIYKSVR